MFKYFWVSSYTSRSWASMKFISDSSLLLWLCSWKVLNSSTLWWSFISRSNTGFASDEGSQGAGGGGVAAMMLTLVECGWALSSSNSIFLATGVGGGVSIVSSVFLAQCVCWCTLMGGKGNSVEVSFSGGITGEHMTCRREVIGCCCCGCCWWCADCTMWFVTDGGFSITWEGAWTIKTLRWSSCGCWGVAGLEGGGTEDAIAADMSGCTKELVDVVMFPVSAWQSECREE